jgi:hypothetical protein
MDFSYDISAYSDRGAGRDAYADLASAFEQTSNYLDAYPVGFIVDGKSGTGVGSPNFHTFPKGNYSLPGTPKIYFNAYAIYKTPVNRRPI